MYKNILFLFVSAALLFVSACSDDDDNSIVEVDNPQVSITDAQNIDNSILLPGDTVRFSVQGQAGTNPLQHVRFFENGERLPNFATRLFVNDSLSPATQLNIAPGSANSVSLDINVMILVPQLGGNYEVEIELADPDENTSRASLSYFVKDVVESEGVLENSEKDGPTGGLDLSSGESTSFESTSADIIDFGNDPDGSWQQRIANVDTNLVADRPLQLVVFDGGLDFDGVLTKAEVRERFQEGEIVEDSGREVETGEVYGLQRGVEYFLLSVASVNNSQGDNNDSYTFSIKAAQ